jgi:hypothetical protein
MVGMLIWVTGLFARVGFGAEIEGAGKGREIEQLARRRAKTQKMCAVFVVISFVFGEWKMNALISNPS